MEFATTFVRGGNVEDILAICCLNINLVPFRVKAEKVRMVIGAKTHSRGANLGRINEMGSTSFTPYSNCKYAMHY